MKRKNFCLKLILIAAECGLSLASLAQQAVTAGASTVATATTSAVPKVVSYSGTLTDVSGKPLTGITGVTVLLYNEAEGGAPLWLETQNVQPGKDGRYSVTLGSTSGRGLPEDAFVSGTARWLAVQVQGQSEQPRVLLVAVPYAVKSADSETLGGLPASAFLLAAPGAAVNSPATGSGSSSNAPPPAAITGSGTAGFLPDFTGAATIGNSAVFQSGVSPTAKVGINTNAPTSALDIHGGSTVRGTLIMPATGVATAVAGKASQPVNLAASAFNSGTSTAVAQTFQLKAEPVGNNTATASGSLNVLYGSGTAIPAETGLKIANNGKITFAAGQTFPGTGPGTVTSVASGAGLSGGPITGAGTLSIASAGVTNAMLQHPSLTVTAGTGLSGGGAVALGASTSLGINTAVVPQLNTPNAFTQAISVNTTNPFGSVQATSTGEAIVGTMTSNDLLTAAITGNATATGTGSTIGVEGSSSTTTGYGVYGFGGSAGAGVYGGSSGGYGVYGNTTSGYGVYGNAPSGIGVYGTGNDGGIFVGSTNGFYGSSSTLSADATFAVGAAGWEYGSTKETVGVSGYSASPIGIGSYGEGYATSAIALTCCTGIAPIGVWGDTSGIASATTPGIGVLATADYGYGLVAFNNTTSFPAALLENAETADTTSVVLETQGNVGTCVIDVSGNLTCTGTKSAVVPVNGGASKVALYAVEAPENWFEDYGSARLSNGSAVINIENMFGQAVNTDVNYHVFLTPDGDCKGLYVSQKSPNSFEVHELGGGTTSVEFDYRIIAKRKGYENVRMADKTAQFSGHQLKRRPAGQVAPNADEYRKAHQLRAQALSNGVITEAARKK